MTEPAFYSPAQAAAVLGISYKTLIRQADAGRIPCVRIGCGWRRFPVADIDAIAAGRRAAERGGKIAVRYELRCAHERAHPSTAASYWFDESKLDLAWEEHDRRNAEGRSDCQPWTVHEITTTVTDRQLDPGARPDA